MAFSLYYEAKRESKMSEQEHAVCQAIIEKYCSKYPFKGKTEDFGVYEINKETDIIFSGSTKLPDLEPEMLFEVANYWLKCLTEITNTLMDCQWDVTFDEIDLVLDSKEGWRFPTDEEYGLLFAQQV